MRMLPSHCLPCGQLALVAEAAVGEDATTRCTCGASARILPHVYYEASDAPLFDAIVASLRAAGITWMNAARLLVALDACASPRPLTKLKVLEQLAPALPITALVAAEKPLVARTALGMFQTLLEALTHARSQSGLLPPVTVAPRFKRRGAMGRS